MTTALFTHPSAREHVTPPGHPEQVARIEAIWRALEAPAFTALDRREAPEASEADLELCHPRGHIEAIRAAIPESRYVALDADTFVSPGSWEPALRAVGGCIAAVDAVLAGEVANAFVAMRPPGHHAERARPMGFCLFGNVAIAARHALERHGLSRVAILDFDVHHGNGTQDLMWDEPRVRFASSHQMPLYPGTGSREERGAHGNIINVPLKPMTGGAEMRAAWDGEILPAIDAFAPELVLVSAGFDAHAADPLAQLNWTEEDFAWLTGRICDVAARHAGGRVVSTLEGGYDLQALAASVAAHVSVLMERGEE
ncbi:Acetoin utilization deacetylase AcuC [Meinhardsimonia xiamenensis]|jgi:acetoin utilization deacetylase AcuC-like enzyme|uniref:Acetoin utilization deacetylase AcuC n=1 Tax=Meinhardsimonia xiamenensis TaxID=990712 RepID=A0A1G8Z4S0_9RHOB|nr:histone deacetylase family protein [Meinhardsimonia xiamenensis]PRX37550.1 acetoin utilization deacetylase AcuC-like enzyme [Meinhardsimonia xiamenensis]SDK09957.1 Acetoin utilization deacetylase AcuC [Meinhardsimonia xiamenensis]